MFILTYTIKGQTYTEKFDKLCDAKAAEDMILFYGLTFDTHIQWPDRTGGK